MAGLNAALNLADNGYPVDLVEKTDGLGGNAHLLSHTWKGEAIGPYIEGAYPEGARITSSSPCICNSQVVQARGFVGNFISTVRDARGKDQQIEHGVAILATGGKELKPDEYLHGEASGRGHGPGIRRTS